MKLNFKRKDNGNIIPIACVYCALTNVRFNGFGDNIGMLYDNITYVRKGSDLIETFRLNALNWDNAPFTETLPNVGASLPTYKFVCDDNPNYEIWAMLKNKLELKTMGYIVASGTNGDSDLPIPYSYDAKYVYIALVDTSQTNRFRGYFAVTNPFNISMVAGGSDLPINQRSKYSQVFYSASLLASVQTYNGEQRTFLTIEQTRSALIDKCIFGTRNSISNLPTAWLASFTINKQDAIMFKVFDNTMGIYKGDSIDSLTTSFQDAQSNYTGQYYYTRYGQTFMMTDIAYNDDDDDDDGDAPDDGESDDNLPEYPPSIVVDDLVTIYQLSQTDISTLGQQLWTKNVVADFFHITGYPIDSIIALKAIFYTPNLSGQSQRVQLGNVAIQITAPTIRQIISTINFGTVSIQKRYGNYLDYAPYTQISIFLPFIGNKRLDTNLIMNNNIILTYNINVLDGSCVAQLTSLTTKTILYQFEGSCDMNIPVSAYNTSLQLLNFVKMIGNLGTAGVDLAKGGVPINTFANGFENFVKMQKPEIDNINNMQSSNGVLGSLTPYFIIKRPIATVPSSYNQNIGTVSLKTEVLSSLSGFTQVNEIFISNFTGVEDEYDELITLLKKGVIF